MRNDKILFLIAFIFLALCSLALPAQEKSSNSTQLQIPPVNLLKCIDIEVNSLTAILVSSQLGDPAVEIPHDTVKLRVVLKNVGGLPLPLASMNVYMNRNNESFLPTRYFRDILQAKGSIYEVTFTDTFPHGVKTTYTVYYQLDALIECTTKNNKASLTINEVKLHRVKPGRMIKR
jgi:hypothetical protein